MRILFPLILILNTHFAKAQDTIYLDYLFSKVENSEQALYYRLSERNNSQAPEIRNITYNLDGSTVMDESFKAFPKNDSIRLPIIQKHIQNTEFSTFTLLVDDEIWVYNGNVKTYWSNGQRKRYDYYEYGLLINGTTWNIDGDEIEYTPYMVQPYFPGGHGAFIKYLEENLQYPRRARREGILGTVVVSFEVDIDGKLTNMSIFQSVHPLLDREAIRVLSSVPRWVPGFKDNLPVRMKFFMPINFVLD